MITNQYGDLLNGSRPFWKCEKEWVPKFWHPANSPPCSRKALAPSPFTSFSRCRSLEYCQFLKRIFFFHAIFAAGSNKNEFCEDFFSVVLIKYFLTSVEAWNCNFVSHSLPFICIVPFWFCMWRIKN